MKASADKIEVGDLLGAPYRGAFKKYTVIGIEKAPGGFTIRLRGEQNNMTLTFTARTLSYRDLPPGSRYLGKSSTLQQRQEEEEGRVTSIEQQEKDSRDAVTRLGLRPGMTVQVRGSMYNWVVTKIDGPTGTVTIVDRIHGTHRIPAARVKQVVTANQKANVGRTAVAQELHQVAALLSGKACAAATRFEKTGEFYRLNSVGGGFEGKVEVNDDRPAPRFAVSLFGDNGNFWTSADADADADLVVVTMAEIVTEELKKLDTALKLRFTRMGLRQA